MAESGPVSEDPLIAALPPATDYITYLTLLEYQLTPQNLGTLNQLLASDDGKLAEEIGWDLLKLVLPMLETNLKDATACLELIARRGNPREVVVQVAEELEKLGRTSEEDDRHDDSKYENSNSEDDDDELTTFAGEATRIHLGKMRLDGSIEPLDNTDDTQKRFEMDREESKSSVAEEMESIKLQKLLLLLGILHPRIKTQYPSRFLATSLPAALGAYRRSHMDSTTTSSFLTLLRKLSGKQKPVLPPRTPSNVDTSNGPVSIQSAAPLPDPEANTESTIRSSTSSELEKSINDRLLQAVLLELLDEYMSSFQSEDSPCMAWTHRLREEFEPESILARGSSGMKYEEKLNYNVRDDMCQMFISCAAELSLTVVGELSKIAAGNDKQDLDPLSADPNDEVSEYPTSPSQIDFPSTGLILLYAAEQFYEVATPEQLSLSDIQNLIGLIMPLSKEPLLPSLSVQDALLSLLYRSVMTSDTSSLDTRSFTQLLSILTQAFTITPSSQTRDDAHHIATQLLHTRLTANERLEIIKQTIQCSTPDPERPESEPIPLAPPLTEGALKAVGVDWLKDEFRAFLAVKQSPASTANNTTTTQPSKGLNPTILETDTNLHALVFTTIPPPPSALHPPRPTTLTFFLCSLPFYISILNLLCILLSNPTSNQPSSLRKIATTQLHSLEAWREYLLPFLPGSSESKDVDEEMVGEVRDSGPDVFALDDACGRLRALIEKA